MELRRHRDSRRALLGAALVALALGAVLALNSSSGAANPPHRAQAAAKGTLVQVPLPDSGRQMFALSRFTVKQGDKPGKIKDVEVRNVEEIPDTVRAGAATAGPFKKKGDKWEFILLVGLNDLGGGARSSAEADPRGGIIGPFMDFYLRSAAGTEHPPANAPATAEPCVWTKFKDQIEYLVRKKFIRWREANKQLGYPTPDEEVMRFAMEDARKHC